MAAAHVKAHLPTSRKHQHCNSMTAAQSEATAKERVAARNVALQQRQADLEQRIRELGSLPADAYGMHTGRSTAQLEKLLKKANAELKKYT